MSLVVIEPGLQVTVQDLGRRGLMSQGLSRGGAMDQFSLRWANRIVGNADHTAALEIAFGQCHFEFNEACTIAITGADLNAQINGQCCSLWQSHTIRKGDRLKFATPLSGLRAYLSISGGFVVPSQLGGSSSTVPRESLGGFCGRALAKGDTLSVGPSTFENAIDIPLSLIPNYQSELVLRIIPGYQYKKFSKADHSLFTRQAYQLGQQIDRMGYRFEGKSLATKNAGLLSEGNATGAVQIPPDGRPIILMRDGQTIGGYLKMGCVASVDLDHLSQRLPGTTVRFCFSHWRDVYTAELLSIL